MVVPAVDGIDLFKIANRSISGWIPIQSTYPTQKAYASDRETLVGHRKNRLGCCRHVDLHLRITREPS